MVFYPLRKGKMNIDDINAEVEMSLKQIISLTDLMLEHGNENIPNILTIRGLAQVGLEKQLKLSNGL